MQADEFCTLNSTDAEETDDIATIHFNCLRSRVLRLDMRLKYFYSKFNHRVIIELLSHLVQFSRQGRVNTEFKPEIYPVSFANGVVIVCSLHLERKVICV